MPEEAFRLLGLEPDADARTVESTYWSRARELNSRSGDPAAAAELGRVNQAYEAISRYLATKPPRPRPRARRSYRGWAVAGIASAALLIAGLVAGTAYRQDITDLKDSGVTEAQDRWDETIEWLQSLDGPTPTPPAPPAPQ